MIRDESDDIQGIIVTGYGHLRRQRFLFIEFPDPRSGKISLQKILPDVTTANWTRNGIVHKPEFAVNIAFSHRGLRAIGYPDQGLDQFSPEFITGMADPERSRRLGDVGRNDPSEWEIGGPRLHALLILQAASEGDLDILQKKYSPFTLAAEIQRGWMTENNREHFGFADGVSQPDIEGSPLPPRGKDVVPAGEFVLGYPNANGMFPATPTIPADDDSRDELAATIHALSSRNLRDFGRNGTYLVFRKLSQNVPEFRRFIRNNAPPHLRTLIAAKMVGRWPSGAPLTLFPDKDPESEPTNDFNYHATDRNGLACPIGAHIRRANPRDDLEHDPEQSLRTVMQHRILRRGVLYGPPLAEDAEDDRQDRGLFFICVNADIRRQFEFVQQTWLNNPKFSGLVDERDPLVGGLFDPLHPYRIENCMTIQDAPVRRRLRQLPQFVTMRGGEYFFLPGMSALRYLSAL